MSQKQAKKLRKEMRRQAQQAQVQPRPFTLVVPEAWLDDPNIESIWVAAFQVLFAAREEFALGDKVLDLGDVRIIFGFGSLQYEKLQIEIQDDPDNPTVHTQARESGLQETPEGVYALVLVPATKNQITNNQHDIQEKISVATGLLASVIGENVVYERIFERVSHRDGTEDRYSNLVRIRYARVDISDPRLSLLSQINQAILALPHDEQNRFRLSLRWFEKAIRERGVDAYLNYWFALETLAMPHTSNVRPINELLAYAYNLPLDEVKSKFIVGRLQDVRAKIVHDGRIFSDIDPLSDYAAALYTDVLYQKLGLASERRAMNMLEQPNFSVYDYLRNLYRM